MRNDRKLKAVRMRYGIEGYAIYNMLLETLAEEDLLQIPLTDINYDLIAADFAIQIDRLKDMISYFTQAGLNLMQVKKSVLRCSQLDNRMKAVFSKRGFSLQKLRESIVSATETGVSGEFLEHPVAETGIVKQSKAKQSINTYAPNQKKITFDFVASSWLDILDSDKKLWSEAYPACNIDLELKQMAAWLVANPKKRKSNYKRFISGWLTRTQDKGGTRGIQENKQKNILKPFVPLSEKEMELAG